MLNYLVDQPTWFIILVLTLSALLLFLDARLKPGPAATVTRAVMLLLGPSAMAMVFYYSVH